MSRRIVSSPQPTTPPNSFTDRYRSGLWESIHTPSLLDSSAPQGAKAANDGRTLEECEPFVPPFLEERRRLHSSTGLARGRRPAEFAVLACRAVWPERLVAAGYRSLMCSGPEQ